MEYDQERFILNNLCEFRDRHTESDFLEFEKSTSLNIIRALTLLMGFIFAIFSLSDYYYYGSKDIFAVSVGLRGTGLLIAVITFTYAGRFRRHAHTLIMVTAAELAVFAIYLLNLYILEAREASIQYMTVMLFILTVFLIPNRWKNCLVAGCTIWVCYIIFCIAFQDLAVIPSLVQRAIYLGIGLFSCILFLYGRGSSQRKQFAAEQLLEYMSITDRLTGIYNRGRFEHILGLWIKNKRHDPFCLLLFDIDDFKKVNDSYGHIAGDHVLVGITSIVSRNIRDDDIFARWGGEEFIVLFGSTGIERAAELAERLRKAVEAHSYDEIGTVTISIGVVQYRREESIPDFVNRADEKMYEAKKAGKNLVVAEILTAPETVTAS